MPRPPDTPPRRSRPNLDIDGDLAASVSLVEIDDRLGHLTELIRAVDHRGEFAVLNHLLESNEVFAVHRRDEGSQLLSYEEGHHLCPDLSICATEPPPIALASGDDKGAFRSKDESQAPQCRVPTYVDNHMEAVVTIREIRCLVDVSERRDLAHRYNVLVVPTTFAVAPDGRVLARLV